MKNTLLKTSEVIDTLDESHIIEKTEFLGEYTIEVNSNHLKEVLAKLKKASYRVLIDLTAVDYLEPTLRTKLIYWMHNPENFERLRIVIFALRGESVPSVIDLFEGATWYERELYDMFGITFDGHPDLKRILMPDDFVGHPMLKSYALTEVPVEFKGYAKPKIPSEIIPNVKNKLKIHYD